MENIQVAVGDNLRVWVVTLTGAKGTIYAGEKYKLKVRPCVCMLIVWCK